MALYRPRSWPVECTVRQRQPKLTVSAGSPSAPVALRGRLSITIVSSLQALSCDHQSSWRCSSLRGTAAKPLGVSVPGAPATPPRPRPFIPVACLAANRQRPLVLGVQQPSPGHLRMSCAMLTSPARCRGPAARTGAGRSAGGTGERGWGSLRGRRRAQATSVSSGLEPSPGYVFNVVMIVVGCWPSQRGHTRRTVARPLHGSWPTGPAGVPDPAAGPDAQVMPVIPFCLKGTISAPTARQVAGRGSISPQNRDASASAHAYPAAFG
mgnify:CR=1 FL=1